MKCADMLSVRCMQRNLDWLPKQAKLDTDEKNRIVASWYHGASHHKVVFRPDGTLCHTEYEARRGSSGILHSLEKLYG